MPRRSRDLPPGRERLRLEHLEQLEQSRGRREHPPSQAHIEGLIRPLLPVASPDRPRRKGSRDARRDASDGDGARLRLPVRPLERAQPAPAQRLAGVGRVGGVRGHERRAAAARRARERGRVPHRPRRRHDRHVVPLLRRGDGAVVDLLGRQPALRPAGSAGHRLVRRRRRGLRGAGRVRGPADPRALHLVEHPHSGAALGAGLLGGRRRDLGDELDHGIHARGGRRDEPARPGRRSRARLQAHHQADPARRRPCPWPAGCSSGTTSPRPSSRSRPRSRRWRTRRSRSRCSGSTASSAS